MADSTAGERVPCMDLWCPDPQQRCVNCLKRPATPDAGDASEPCLCAHVPSIPGAPDATCPRCCPPEDASTEQAAGLRARLTLAEKTMSAIEDEHAEHANARYCDEGSCRECQIIERINLALAGEA